MVMKRRHFDLIIFDLDGTLIDSLEDIAEVANQCLEEAGMMMHPVSDYRFFVGDGLATLIRRITPADTSKQVEKRLSARFKTLYKLNWNNKTCLYPGVITLLKLLSKSGIKMAILSNKPDAFTKLCVKEYLAEFNFDLVIGQRENIPLKPHPQAALEIVDAIGVSPKTSLFMGDTAVDIKTGKAAGMKTIGVTWGFRREEELREAGADIIITNPEELISHVHYSS